MISIEGAAGLMVKDGGGEASEQTGRPIEGFADFSVKGARGNRDPSRRMGVADGRAMTSRGMLFVVESSGLGSGSTR